MLDGFFKISERGSTVARELRGGVVTFFTMAYIVVLNPLIIGSFAPTGPGSHPDVLGNILPVGQVAAVTALVAGVMTILFGLIANYPFALATGLGINSFVAVSVAAKVTWPEAMGLILVNGLVVLLLVVTGVRTAVFNAVPNELKAAIAVGIGLFICFIGLVDAGFVRRLPDAANTTVPVGLGINGSIASWPTLVFVVGLVLTGVLFARRIKGAILIGIVATAIFAIVLEAIVKAGPSAGVNAKGWNLGYPALPDQVFGIPDLSLLGEVVVRRVDADSGARRRADRLHAGADRLLRHRRHHDRPGQGGRPDQGGRPAAQRRARPCSSTACGAVAGGAPPARRTPSTSSRRPASRRARGRGSRTS